jgi:hypothetical protein
MMQPKVNKIVRVTAMAAAALLTISSAATATPPEDADPTCSDVLGISVHGEHVIGDYVTGDGTGSDDGFPPDGSFIGQTVSANGGAAIPGGPGPGFHFLHGVAPGASFCNDSQSPGAHF